MDSPKGMLSVRPGTSLIKHFLRLHMKFARFFAAFALVMATTVATPVLAQADANCSVFYAGQDEAVGSVCVTINDGTAYLDYFLENDWTMSEAHAWIGDNLGDMPQNNGGNPQIGLFPYTATGLDNVTEYSVAIPVSELQVNLDTFCSADVFVAAHGVVHKIEEGTGGGDEEEEDDSDHSQKSGKSEKSSKGSYKSSKSGYGSDGSDKSDKSAKRGKGGKSDKSAKRGKGGKSDKSAKRGKGGKSDKSAKSSGKSRSSNIGYGSNGSDKSGKSGYSTKGSHKSQKDAEPSTTVRTESAWAGNIEIGDGGSWASYFTFTNDFCPQVEIVVPQGCYNTFMNATGQSRFGMVSNTLFAPIGTVDTTSAWLVEFRNTSTNRGVLSNDTGTQPAVGNVSTSTTTDARVVTFSTGNELVLSANIYYGPAGSFQNVSPLEYGYHADNLNGASAFSMVLPLMTATSYDMVVHAVVCAKISNE
jgi:hypothetical protein